MAESSPAALPPDSPDVPLADLEEAEDGTQSEPIDVPDDPQEEEAEETQDTDVYAEGPLKKDKKREKAVLDVTRRPGKTNLPIARVQKVLKADRVRSIPKSQMIQEK